MNWMQQKECELMKLKDRRMRIIAERDRIDNEDRKAREKTDCVVSPSKDQLVRET